MSLIWTYNNKVIGTTSNIRNLKNFYKRSIRDAKGFGHITEMYSNDKEFEEVVDVFHFIEKETMFWDEYKMLPLKREDEEIVLVDGDIIWHQSFRLNKNVDVVIDSHEVGIWDSLYRDDVEKLTALGIGKVIPEWDGKRRQVFNTGLLSFNNKELQRLYVDRYERFKQFIMNHRDRVNINRCTWIGAQYLLTSIVDVKGYSHYAYSKKIGENNGMYTHHVGEKKDKGSFNPLIY